MPHSVPTRRQSRQSSWPALLLCCFAALFSTSALAQPLTTQPAIAHPLPDLWLYCPTNLLVDQNVSNLELLFYRAAAAGYTKVLIADSKFGFMQDQPPKYLANIQKVKAFAVADHLELIPAIFPIGWSNDILWNDPNLAEGIPVAEALFTTTGNSATLQPDPPITLKGGDFSNINLWDWHDDSVTQDGGAARVQNPPGNARIVQKVKVSPNRQYHISVRIKTQNFTTTPEVKVLANQHDYMALNYDDLGVAKSQDWTTHHAVFNSLDNTEVTLYLGIWGGSQGTLWWDDCTFDEVGLLNILRRPGAPVTVSIENGPQLVEGVDYAAISDPRMGNQPWNGSYEVWHTPPVITLLKNLPNSTRLRVSYSHPMIIYSGSVCICPSEPKTTKILQAQAQHIHDAFNAKSYFMSHDEIRVWNRCPACTARNLTSGQILADNAAACTDAIRTIAPNCRLYIWSDMFDPNHNAHDNYYLARGTFTDSWLGLTPDITIANWNFGERDKSLAFFASRGHKQIIAGYYDGPVSDITKWLDSARNVKGVVGVMYTTWQGDYSNIEAFAKTVRNYK